ncbi:arabinan endo-1,5-alpha-L-arabinosidase [Galbibacter sp.]|uniref:arabinan endo-1,5-alpha-L-arabinosidase n=1 Tax=Galbibacter sp. TaxID=2918471 RepID=UPI003A8DC1FA
MKILAALIFIWGINGLRAQDIIVHDPVAIEHDGQYYLFSTGHGISWFSSKDMKNWKKEEPVFKQAPLWTNTVVPGFKNHIWAPDISFHNGMYYLYYSVSSFGKNTSAIGLVTNKTLDSASEDFQWEDQGIVIQSVPNRDLWNAIDPNLIFDDQNTPWLAFGSFWNGLKLVQLNSDLKTLAQPERWHTIARRKRDFKYPDSDAGNAALEAPFIFKKNGYYYLFLSWDYCCRAEESTYKIVVGRSKTVSGPYLDKQGKALFDGGGTVLLEGNANWYGLGHNSVYTFDQKDYMFFHAYDAHDGGKPKLGILTLDWDSEKWPIFLKKELNKL